MLLGAALQELKIMQSKLARLYSLRVDTFNYLENKAIEVEFDKVTGDIENLIAEVRDLKVKINKTNANTVVEVEGKTMPLQELIILIGDLRSDLYQYQILVPRGPVYLGGQAVEYFPQRGRNEIADIIAKIEKRKADLDKLLQAKNWSTELLD